MNVQIAAAVLTASDSRDVEDDVSGAALVALLLEIGARVEVHLVVPDDLAALRETMYGLAERDDINLLVTTGGTGLSPRDNTPEATLSVIEREVPGIAEAMRRQTAVNTPMAMLSRGVAGIRGSTLIVNFPGSPKAVRECFEVIRPILAHAIEQASGHTDHDA